MIKHISLILILFGSSLVYGMHPNDLLLAAAKKGDLASVKKAKSQGAFINFKENQTGLSPLEAAAGTGYPEVVKYLLSQGANVNIRDNYGMTPLMFAASMGFRPAVVVALLHTPTMGEAIDVNAKDNQGRTALMHAASTLGEGPKKIVDALIGAGADVNLKDERDETALDIAHLHHNQPVIAALEKAGAHKS
jgi:uncharacterized protein